MRGSALADTVLQGRIPGTDRWKPLKENPEAEESVAGALIVRIRESLYFGNDRWVSTVVEANNTFHSKHITT